MASILLDEGPMAGWRTWEDHGVRTFGRALGRLWWKDLPDGAVQVRIETSRDHINAAGALHGGFLMSFADMALYATAWRSLIDHTAVTLTCNTEFLGAGQPDLPIEARCEVLHETGRLIFIRGVIRQETRPLIAFSGSLRKIARSTLPQAGDGAGG